MAYVDGTTSNDSLTPTNPDPDLQTTYEDDLVYGFAGDDSLDGSSGYDTLHGDSGNDTLFGGNDHYGQLDRLYGEDGDDTLIATEWHGGDILEGGAGNDTYIVEVYENGFDPAAPTVKEAVGAGIDTVRSSSTWTLGANFEYLNLEGDSAINGTGNTLNNFMTGNIANNTINGGGGDDQLIGYGGDDSIFGEAGNDLLYESYGNDTLVGGVGNDTYDVGYYGEPTIRDLIVENLNEGTDTIKAYIDYTLGANLENLTLLGSSFGGTGNTLDNTITGNESVNQLLGGVGNDTLFGNAGDDGLYGEEGNDVLIGGDGRDILGGGAGQDTLDGGFDDDRFFGGYGDDLLLGADGNDELYGGEGGPYDTGNDTLNGGSGSDTMNGGDGNDLYIVDNSFDVVNDAFVTDIDTVNSSISFTLSNSLDNLTLTDSSAINGTGNILKNTIKGNSASNTLNGGDDNDTLTGGNGNDKLLGSNGNDVLGGDAGNDTFTGGSGNDKFLYNTNAVFKTASVGIDAIADFTHSIDKFVLDKTTFSAISSVVGTGFSVASEFAIVTSNTAAATSKADIVYNSASGNLFYNQNGTSSGFGTGAQFAILTGTPTISATDFMIQA